MAAEEVIKWAVNGITILLMILAGSRAIKKKNNLALGVAILGNLTAYYFTRSPLLCWIISIGVLIWISRQKEIAVTKQTLKASKAKK